MNQKLKKLDAISITQLYDTELMPKAPIIDKLLFEGVYLFVGAPKVGKSFFVSQLAHHISKGIPLFGHNVRQCDVLYLAFEDTLSRLQGRFSQMFGLESNDHLFLTTESTTIHYGLGTQLLEHIKNHPDAKFIIIDTLQKIREISTECNYSSDYDAVTKLKDLAEQYNICIILVHHTRKQEASDCFDLISGTNGLLGAADGAFVLQKEKRTANKATLDIVGRDQPDQRMYLEFDRQHCIWNFVKSDCELWKEPTDPLLESISEFISEHKSWSGTATELIKDLSPTDISPNVLSRKLNVLSGRLLNDYNIIYHSTRTSDKRLINLSQKGGKC
ncbi:MAG: helicase RepA family protein [Clostridiales bacterium]|nr:helicase RepA family protein [Clostridiales bacterium]